MVNWQDGGIKWEVRASTAGDFVKLGKPTTYPFESGGAGGVPLGWTQYLVNNIGGATPPASDVSWTTSYGRFSIGNLGTNVHHGMLYGIYRDFVIPTGKRWLVQVQCRTTENRSTCIRYVKYVAPAGPGYNYLSQVWSYDDWEDVSLYTSTMNATTMRVTLYAAPYTAADVAPHAPTDVNWGIQFQNFTLVEMESSYPNPTWKTITCDIHGMTTHHSLLPPRRRTIACPLPRGATRGQAKSQDARPCVMRSRRAPSIRGGWRSRARREPSRPRAARSPRGAVRRADASRRACR